jgi:hypothetical protein
VFENRQGWTRSSFQDAHDALTEDESPRGNLKRFETLSTEKGGRNGHLGWIQTVRLIAPTAAAFVLLLIMIAFAFGGGRSKLSMSWEFSSGSSVQQRNSTGAIRNDSCPKKQNASCAKLPVPSGD